MDKRSVQKIWHVHDHEYSVAEVAEVAELRKRFHNDYNKLSWTTIASAIIWPGRGWSGREGATFLLSMRAWSR